MVAGSIRSSRKTLAEMTSSTAYLFLNQIHVHENIQLALHYFDYHNFTVSGQPLFFGGFFFLGGGVLMNVTRTKNQTSRSLETVCCIMFKKSVLNLFRYEPPCSILSHLLVTQNQMSDIASANCNKGQMIYIYNRNQINWINE